LREAGNEVRRGVIDRNASAHTTEVVEPLKEPDDLFARLAASPYGKSPCPILAKRGHDVSERVRAIGEQIVGGPKDETKLLIILVPQRRQRGAERLPNK
jgi:hypothetical protein